MLNPPTQSHSGLQSEKVVQCSFLPGFSDQESEYSVCLIYPIRVEEITVGNVWLYRSQGQSFTDFDTRFVSQAVHWLSSYLQELQKLEKLNQRVKELLDLDAARNDFLGTIVHDLRAPISNIKLAEQLISKALASVDPTDSPIPRYLEIISDSSNYAVELIDDLLDLSNVEQALPASDWVEIDLVVWVESLLEPYIVKASNHNQTVVLEITNKFLPFLTVPAYLRRALLEILHNASKYTPPNETIFVKLEHTLIPSPSMVFAVTNTGVCVTEQERALFFEKFYRIPRLDIWNRGGTGLGLSIVKRIVMALHGEITVSGTSNSVTISVVLPCLSVAPA